MARYVVHVHTPRSQTEAFDYMADLSNFSEWDPGITRAVQVGGQGPGLDAEYDLDVQMGPTSMTMRYRTTAFDPHRLIVARSDGRFLTSVDTITVAANPDGGSMVTYDADLTLAGPLKLADPLLALGFQKVGDKAAAGLVDALDGEEVEWNR